MRGDETRVERLVERLAGLLGANPVRPRRTLPEGAADAPAGGELTAALARFKGNLKFPAVGELVARFGVPRGGSGPASKGWFIRTSSGTPVVAVASGRVVFADWLRGFGNLLIVITATGS